MDTARNVMLIHNNSANVFFQFGGPKTSFNFPSKHLKQLISAFHNYVWIFQFKVTLTFTLEGLKQLLQIKIFNLQSKEILNLSS